MGLCTEGSDRHADVENRAQVGMVGDELGDWYIDICALPRVEQRGSESLLYSAGLSTVHSVMPERDRMGVGREILRGRG